MALLFVVTRAVAVPEGLGGRVLCGYQGWFHTPGDGSGLPWFHYGAGGRFEPGHCGIDLWPDVRGLPRSERVPTPFRHPDGSTGEVYSAMRPGVVLRHFEWMREQGIDGVFLQRFATRTRTEALREPLDRVLLNCRDAARATGRAWAIMYDLSGLAPGETRLVREDWAHVRALLGWTNAPGDDATLRLRGAPLVALWGAGFSDRPSVPEEWGALVDFFHDAPRSGGCRVLLGVPAYWRTLDRDMHRDPAWHEVFARADVLSPWTVGRFRDDAGAAAYAARTWAADREWCRARGIECLPVAFPGFSWHNLRRQRGEPAPLDEIPRRRGDFFWAQCRALHAAGARALYVAMFDELDEGTAIFPTRHDPPVGASPFVAEPGLAPDHYLWLAGQAARLLRGELRGAPARTPSR